MTCYIMSHYVMPHKFMSYLVLPCNGMPYHAISCHTMPCHAMSHHTMSHHVIPCYATSHHVMSFHVMPCHVASIHVHFPTACLRTRPFSSLHMILGEVVVTLQEHVFVVILTQTKVSHVTCINNNIRITSEPN